MILSNDQAELLRQCVRSTLINTKFPGTNYEVSAARIAKLSGLLKKFDEALEDGDGHSGGFELKKME